ncbi:DNA-processing protein DprA [Paenibacillus turpanensis]|uniref:DNA-processing protein DprA n=1 Tax=Paenibacillus turpanensis TaxID=2689078 RepID=UPI00140B84FC|nr:DNA-processing protein DprA [Paenibacillus turpanensis]
MMNSEIVFGLHELEGIGGKSIEWLLDQFPDLSILLEADGWHELVRERLGEKRAGILKSKLSETWIAERMEEYRKQGIRLVTRLDEDYPLLLGQTAQPPWVLYTKGDLELLNNPSIAVVGTREATPYGRKVAYTLSADLSRAGVTIISGLAKGIDTAAHRGALEGRGSTIAVMGTGFDHIYPPQNAALFEQISTAGLVITEYPIGTKPHPGLFPQRNRIIAGVSLGTLVVEASARSGSLITADLAMEENRDIFVVPGAITSKQSTGTLQLIRQGAAAVGSAAHILEEYQGRLGELPTKANDAEILSEDGSLEHTYDPPEELKIIDILSSEPANIDQLQQLSGIEFGLLHSVLINLIIKKKIKPMPGMVYTLC